MLLAYTSIRALLTVAPAVLAPALAAALPVTHVYTTGDVTGINAYPLGTTGASAERYQQVYGASLFDALPGPVTIHAIAFRTTAVDGGTTRSIDLTLRASASHIGPATITSNYDGNVGSAPQTVVYDDTFMFTTAGDGTFDVVLTLTTPYEVPPGSNLLLDFDTDSISGGGVGFEFHASSPTTGRAFTIPGTGTHIGAPHQGLYTRFTVTTPPCTVDLNGDTTADVLDFLLFIEAYAACEFEPAGCTFEGIDPDFSGDDTIDILDFLEFFDLFGVGCMP